MDKMYKLSILTDFVLPDGSIDSVDLLIDDKELLDRIMFLAIGQGYTIELSEEDMSK